MGILLIEQVERQLIWELRLMEQQHEKHKMTLRMFDFVNNGERGYLNFAEKQAAKQLIWELADEAAAGW